MLEEEMMYFFTEAWYKEYYQNATVDSKDLCDLITKLGRIYKKASEWQEKEFEKISDGFPLKQYSLHDSNVYKMEYDGRDLVMHLDSNNMLNDIKGLQFKNAIIRTPHVTNVHDVNLDWFQTEVSQSDGKYRISILFRDFGSEAVKPVIYEIEAGDVCCVR